MKHKVEYLIPGSFFPEEYVRELSKRDVEEAVANAPESAFCFTLYDVEEAPDLGPDFTVVPKAKNKSKRYYLGGTLHRVEEVEAMGHDILASNMRSNKWDQVIQCRTHNWQPFEDGDVLVVV